ncbi:MAG: DNA polymerase III subunit beta [Candidatus Omnitrophica bacterium]|nr:DNA polymerase III subunit beta [Candidatus Omnitrophota bacterium]MDD4012766.1 DNA polymerase III subunit beta [Candidatus Omnitrophota bacterium]
MDFKILKERLVEGIQTVQNAVSQKSSLPILSNVLMETDNGRIRLTATDLDIGISSSIDALSVSQEGSIAIPAKKFFDIVRALPDGSDIEISMKKANLLNIKSGKANFKIVGFPKDEFPQLPVFQDKDSITMEQKELKEMMNLTDFAISKDDTRYVLNGTFLAIKGDTVEMVATDGRRLAAATKKLQKKTLVDRAVIIPTKTEQEIKRMLQDEGEVKIHFSDNQVLFSFPNSFVLSRLIEGEYPNYKKVIPDRSTKEVKVYREEFLSATKRASIFTDQDSMAIKMNIKKKKLMISKNTSFGEAKEEIDIDYTGDDDLEIGFNPRYLIDVLKSLEDQEITFEVSDASKPGVIRKGGEYTYVVLPMQLAA